MELDGQTTETNENKRARALARLAQPDAAALSDRAIARELEVSQPFISNLRRALAGDVDADVSDRGESPRRSDVLGELQREQRDIKEHIAELEERQLDAFARGDRDEARSLGTSIEALKRDQQMNKSMVAAAWRVEQDRLALERGQAYLDSLTEFKGRATDGAAVRGLERWIADGRPLVDAAAAELNSNDLQRRMSHAERAIDEARQWVRDSELQDEVAKRLVLAGVLRQEHYPVPSFDGARHFSLEEWACGWVTKLIGVAMRHRPRGADATREE